MRMMSACQCSLGKGPRTVFSHHRRYFDQKDDDRHPREIFVEDLCAETYLWIEAGDQIILIIDSNEHVMTGTLAEKLDEMGLTEAITGKHHEEQGLQPTHQVGSKPKHGIFSSRSILMQAGVCLPFSLSQSNHRAISIKLKFNNIFGQHFQSAAPYVHRRVQCQNPRVGENF